MALYTAKLCVIYAECRYAECRYAESFMLSVIYAECRK